ncbi:MAG: acyloxyacyl hydrolase [Acidobacteriota bacterium]
MSLRSIPLIALLGLALSAPALAADGSSGWAFSAGGFDPFKEEFRAVELGIEYRFEAFDLWGLSLKPVAGFSGTDENAFWGYGGLRWDIPIWGERIIPTLGFAVSLYEDGDGKDLGGVLEFRSSFEIAYRFDNGHRLGLSVYHLSNASIYDFNPGSESVILTWSLGR